MRGLVPALAAAAWLGSWSLPASAQEMPRYDIEANCAFATPLSPEDRDPRAGCVRDERSARDDLPAIWAAATAQSRRTCAEEQSEAPYSYVELVTCLQLFGPMTSERPRRLRKPRR